MSLEKGENMGEETSAKAMLIDRLLTDTSRLKSQEELEKSQGIEEVPVETTDAVIAGGGGGLGGDECTKANPTNDEMKFMKDFDPSERLKRKKMKRFTESGIVREQCDCLIPSCPGCHFYACKTCGSHCCGHECRRGRRWDYEEIEITEAGNTSSPKKRKHVQF